MLSVSQSLASDPQGIQKKSGYLHGCLSCTCHIKRPAAQRHIRGWRQVFSGCLCFYNQIFKGFQRGVSPKIPLQRQYFFRFHHFVRMPKTAQNDPKFCVNVTPTKFLVQSGGVSLTETRVTQTWKKKSFGQLALLRICSPEIPKK